MASFFHRFLLSIFLSVLSSASSDPGVSVFKHGEGGFPCIRAPSIVSTNSGVLIAFAMCRLYTAKACTPTNYTTDVHVNDPPNGYLCSKRSIDGGQTWSNLSFPFGLSYYSRVGASVYDAFHNQIIFQSTVYDQSANESVFQLISTDDGETWNYPPQDIGRLYLNGVGANHLIGPGNGLQLKNGRILFIAHHEKQDNGTTPDRVWYSDDFGATYKLSETLLYNITEATMVELQNGSVMINGRGPECGMNETVHCRGIVISNDHGTTFVNKTYPDAQLTGPGSGGCEGSLISTADSSSIYFSNPNSTTMRANMTVKKSTDDGNTWDDGYLVYGGEAAYSCLTTMNGTQSKHIGILFEMDAEDCSGSSCQIRFVNLGYI